MAVVNNTLSEIGDVIIFKTSILSAIDSLDSFSDSVVGELGDRFFDKQFRYTLDLINWSEYEPLTNGALMALDIDPTYDIQLEYKYTRAGVNATGLLEFEWINLVSTTVTQDCGDAFDNSIFNYFFDDCGDDEILSWCSNVLQKIYQPGIVSQTLVRATDDNLNQQDRDYIDLWRAISCFFALHVAYIRKFELFDQDKELLARYLESKGLYVDRNQTIQSLIHLMRTFHNQMSKRGTLLISTTTTEDVDGDDFEIDGELLRVIRYDKQCDEFMFAPNNPNTIGWVVDINSPLNKYIHDNPFLVKLFQDPTAAPLIQPASVSLVTEDGYENVFKIENVLDTEQAGIGIAAFDADFVTNVDPTIPYELQFWVKGDGLLSATIEGYDKADVLTLPSLTIPIITSTEAIKSASLANTTTWFLVKIIIYPTNEAIVTQPAIQKPNIGVGWNLKWKAGTCKAGIKVLMDRTIAANTPPTTVDQIIAGVANDALVTLTLDDLIAEYNDIEDNPFESIDITAFSGPGDLLLDSVAIAGFPQTVTKQEIIDGKLQFDDDGTVLTSKDITITYDVNDEQPIGSDGDILYIRDVIFKPLKTTYGKGIIGSPLLVETWLKNRSELSNQNVNEIITQLIPHNVSAQNNFLLEESKTGLLPILKGLYEERYEDLYQ